MITHGFDKSPKNWDFENEEGEFSEADDEESRHRKQSNITEHKRFMTEWARTCGASIRGSHVINQPFHSFGSGFNNSEQFFGGPKLFLEGFEPELARRVVIMRKLFLDEYQDQILLYIKLSDDLAEGRDTKIPDDDASLTEITAAGWTLGNGRW